MLTFPTHRTCSTCRGRGRLADDRYLMPGWLRSPLLPPIPGEFIPKTCPDCHGSGFIREDHR